MSEPRASTPRRAIPAARLLALFGFGVAICLHYGRRGYMPLDQSIVFDGGWRVLSGQVPFRDYHAPNGLVPHAMQAAFFAVLGVSWFAYCVHAAIVNGLFACLVDRMLVRFGLGGGPAFVYAAASAVVLYPPFGVPYMDAHAFFFSLAAVAQALVARTADGRRAAVWTAFVPVTLALAYLSKQIPTAFVVPLALGIACAGARPLRRVAWLAAGSVAIAAFAAALAVLLEVDLDRLRTYFIEMPAAEGERRLAYVPTAGAVFERMRATGEALGLHTLTVVHGVGAVAAAIGLLVLLPVRLRHGALGPRTRALAPVVAAGLLGEALLLVCLLFVALTSNQPEIGVPYVFVAVGLAHLAALRLARSGSGPSVPLRVLGVGLLALTFRDALHFNRTVNETRTVNDIEYDAAEAEAASAALPEALSYMRFQVPAHAGYSAEDLGGVAAWLAERREPFFLLGDTSILYGVVGQPSVAPSLWFHPGLLLPFEDDPAFAGYEDLLLASMERHGARLVVQEGDATWIARKLEHFPRLSARVAEGGRELARFGKFRVIELGD